MKKNNLSRHDIQKIFQDMKLSKLSKDFLVACRKGNVPKVKECLRKGVDVNVQDNDGYSAAMIAIEEVKIGKFEASIEILKILSEVEAFNWNLRDRMGRNVVNLVGTYLHDESLEILKKVKNLNWNAETIWHSTIAIDAVKYRNVELVKYLVERNDIDWNIKSEDYDGDIGDTAVLIASQFLGGYNSKENLEILRLLLQKQKERKL